MMYSEKWTFKYSEIFTKTLKKLKKKDPVLFKIVMKKRDDIKDKVEMNPNHFKNLRHDLSEYKRVHIDNKFVLTFKVDKFNKIVYFEDFDHHDNIYK